MIGEMLNIFYNDWKDGKLVKFLALEMQVSTLRKLKFNSLELGGDECLLYQWSGGGDRQVLSLYCLASLFYLMSFKQVTDSKASVDNIPGMKSKMAPPLYMFAWTHVHLNMWTFLNVKTST